MTVSLQVESWDQNDNCEVSRKSLGTCTVSRKSLDASRIAVEALGRV